jgi:hypothetical protein
MVRNARKIQRRKQGRGARREERWAVGAAAPAANGFQRRWHGSRQGCLSHKSWQAPGVVSSCGRGIPAPTFHSFCMGVAAGITRMARCPLLQEGGRGSGMSLDNQPGRNILLSPRASRLAPRASRLAPRASRLAPRASRLAPELVFRPVRAGRTWRTGILHYSPAARSRPSWGLWAAPGSCRNCGRLRTAARCR